MSEDEVMNDYISIDDGIIIQNGNCVRSLECSPCIILPLNSERSDHIL
jgi:hypothetical protein